jgi:DNA-binding NtrC family response regulator
METRNKILLIENDKRQGIDISAILFNAGFEITVAPHLYNAISAIDNARPDAIMIDIFFDVQTADFISNYIKLPVIILANQLEKEIYRLSDKIEVISIIGKPFNPDTLVTSTRIAFNKINKQKNT